jgi:cytochrome c556
MNSVWLFVNSQFFIALITLLAGSVAWVVYSRQRSDKKRDIANSILSEIQYAEKAIARVKNYIRDTEKVDINIQTIQMNSWALHKHLFSSNFDEDEWNAINGFFSNAALLNETLKQSNAVFESNAEQIRANMQRALADLVTDTVVKASTENLESSLKLLNDRVELFDQIYEAKKKEFTFTPMKYINDAQQILDDMTIISTSTAGEKLKKLSGKHK